MQFYKLGIRSICTFYISVWHFWSNVGPYELRKLPDQCSRPHQGRKFQLGSTEDILLLFCGNWNWVFFNLFHSGSNPGVFKEHQEVFSSFCGDPNWVFLIRRWEKFTIMFLQRKQGILSQNRHFSNPKKVFFVCLQQSLIPEFVKFQHICGLQKYTVPYQLLANGLFLSFHSSIMNNNLLWLFGGLKVSVFTPLLQSGHAMDSNMSDIIRVGTGVSNAQTQTPSNENLALPVPAVPDLLQWHTFKVVSLTASCVTHGDKHKQHFVCHFLTEEFLNTGHTAKASSLHHHLFSPVALLGFAGKVLFMSSAA